VTVVDGDLQQRAELAIRAWLRSHDPIGYSALDLHYIPHLSTRHFAFYVVTQGGVRHGTRRHIMSDGNHVLNEGAQAFAEVIHRDSPLPADLLAELYCRLVVVPPCAPLTRADHPALEYVPSPTRATFAPPAMMPTSLTFWSVGPKPWHVSRHTVAIAADGTISATKVELGQAPASSA
jgi:hypothetical protein